MKTLFIIVIIFTVTVKASFNCRRDPTYLCKNGDGCNMATGACKDCAAGFEGYDCSVVTADKGHVDCAAMPCKNGGTCHKAAVGTLKCLCHEDYIGATCENKRYDLECNFAGDGSMEMTVTPFVETFSGLVYVKDKSDEPSCTFSGSPPSLGVLSNTDSTCGPTTNTGDERERKVVIQFEPSTYTDLDEIVTFTCGTGDTLEQQSTAITVNALDAAFQSVDANLVPLDEDIDMTLVADSVNADGSVDMGTDIVASAAISAAGQSKFQGFRVEQCFASNKASDTDPDYQSLKFVDASCPHSELRHTMTSPLTKTGDAVHFTFASFKFTDSPSIFLTCNVKLCQNAVDCAPVTCDGVPNTGYGRKKRETGTIDKMLQRSLIINDPIAIAAASTLKEFKETKACYQSWEMTATVVALSVALLLVLLLCIILIIKAILNRRGRTTYREDASDTTSTSHFPHLPTIVPNKC